MIMNIFSEVSLEQLNEADKVKKLAEARVTQILSNVNRETFNWAFAQEFDFNPNIDRIEFSLLDGELEFKAEDYIYQNNVYYRGAIPYSILVLPFDEFVKEMENRAKIMKDKDQARKDEQKARKDEQKAKEEEKEIALLEMRLKALKGK